MSRGPNPGSNGPTAVAPVPGGHYGYDGRPPQSDHRYSGAFERPVTDLGNKVPDEEGVEVVLGSGPNNRDQSIFRGGPPPSGSAVRPRAMRAPPATSPYNPNSGGYGYHSSAGGRRPMQVPYNRSGSFDENYQNSGAAPPLAPTSSSTQHYSPHVHYPQPGQQNNVNVISPNHKPDPYSRAVPAPPGGPPPRHPHGPPPSHRSFYQYPPTSPVSRPGQSGPGSSSNSPRPPSMRRAFGKSSAPQQTYHPDDGTFNAYGPPVTSDRPPVVAESSFDSDQHPMSTSTTYSNPPTPNHLPSSNVPQPSYSEGGTPSSQFYGGPASAQSFGSLDTAPHFDDYRYYGYPPPESPYNPNGGAPSQYSPYSQASGYHSSEQYSPHHHPYDRRYDDDEHRMMGGDYHPEDGAHVYHHSPYHTYMPHYHNPQMKKDKGDNKKNGLDLPDAAREVDFDIVQPPPEPKIQPSQTPVCDSPAHINSNDVLCGRGGGTNSQVGNRRFRKLVQDFQPTYLLARRKEKPLLARSIVLIIRKRGGRFLKKDEETGELYEVGDDKAEAKTSQALREGLDVRASKASSNGKKKKKKGTATKTDEVKADTAAPDAVVSKADATSADDGGDVEKKDDNETENDAEKELGEKVKKIDISPLRKREGDEKAHTNEKKDNETSKAGSPNKKDSEEVNSDTTKPASDSSSSGSSTGAAMSTTSRHQTPPRSMQTEDKPPESPPALPRLAEDKIVHPHSPEIFAFRKRRRMRSGEGCLSIEDKFFPEFCPPRADLARAHMDAPTLADLDDDDVNDTDDTPPRGNTHKGSTPTPHLNDVAGIKMVQIDDDDAYTSTGNCSSTGPGCTGIALSIMTGAATGSFCLGPSKWGGSDSSMMKKR